MSEFQSGLPPRRSRRVEKRKNQVSLKTLIQAGIILFGALFFGLVGWELYHANQAKQTVPATTETDEAAASTESTESTESAASQPTEQAENPVQEETQEGEAPETSADTDSAAQEQAAATNEAASSRGADTAQTAAPAKPAPQAPVERPAAQTSPPVTASTPAPRPAAQPKQPESSGAEPKVVRHVVQKGDTLFGLSRQYYGNNSGVSRIAAYNGLSVDAQLLIGNVVYIPISS